MTIHWLQTPVSQHSLIGSCSGQACFDLSVSILLGQSCPTTQLVNTAAKPKEDVTCSSTFGTLKSADESDQGICDVFVGPDGDVMEVHFPFSSYSPDTSGIEKQKVINLEKVFLVMRSLRVFCAI